MTALDIFYIAAPICITILIGVFLLIKHGVRNQYFGLMGSLQSEKSGLELLKKESEDIVKSNEVLYLDVRRSLYDLYADYNTLKRMIVLLEAGGSSFNKSHFDALLYNIQLKQNKMAETFKASYGMTVGEYAITKSFINGANDNTGTSMVTMHSVN